MKNYLIITLLLALPLSAQIQTGPGGFTPVSGSILKTASVQHLSRMTPDLAELARFSKTQGTQLKFQTHPDFGTPRLLLGALTAPSSGSTETIVQEFLTAQRNLLMLGEGDSFQIKSSKTDELGQTHVNLNLYHDSFEVWPVELKVHLNSDGSIQMVQGVFRSPGQISLQAGKSVEDTVTRTLKHLNLLPDQARVRLDTIIYDWHIDQPVLAYRVHVRGTDNILMDRLCFYNAHTGELINEIDQVCSGKPLATGPRTCTVYPTKNAGQSYQIGGYEENGTVMLINTTKKMYPGHLDTNTLAGTIYVFETNHTNKAQGLASDPNGDAVFNDNTNTHAAGAAAYLVSKTYDWLETSFNRNSWDDNGSAFRVFVNFRSDPTAGLDNAFWTGKELVFGDGGVITTNWAFALDFATHEICHAITSSSANLVYQFQSGALNEAFSDMYGTTHDDRNWILGEDITIAAAFGSPGLRDMSNPSQGKAVGDFNHGWQPSNMGEFQNLAATMDNGGVHINSGIPNHAYYKLATSIGRTKAIQIMHRTLTKYLSKNSQFVDFRTAAEKSASDLYGQGSAEQNAVSQACADVGIGSATQPPPGETGEYALYIPFTSSFEYYGQSYNSNFYIANVGDAAISGKATWYDSNGIVTASSDFSAAPHTMLTGSSSASDQWVKLTANGKMVGAYQHMTADGSSWSLIPATQYISNGMYIPHIATNTQKFWTIGALANVRDTTSSMIYADNLDQAWTVNTNSVGQSLAFDFEGLYGIYPDISAKGGLWGFFLNYDLNTGKVLEQNMVGAEIFGRKDASMAAGLIVDTTSGRNILFPHVAADTNTFWTGYSVVNLSAETAQVRIDAYNNSGSLLLSSIRSIPAFGKLLQVTGNGTPVPTGTSWFLVSALSEKVSLSGMELFGSQDDRQLAGFQATPFVSKKFYFPFVISGTNNRPANFQGLTPNWTGISVINPHSVAVHVTFKIYRSDGALATGTATIQPNNKLLGTIQSLFQLSDFHGYIQIEADDTLAGFSLSGFTDQREMAANPMVFIE
jgi:Zn-dependent metalloprotease